MDRTGKQTEVKNMEKTNDHLNSAFKSACKIILGSEIGELSEYEQFLKRYIVPVKKTKSILSGKDVYYGAPYSEKSKMMSMEEMEHMKIEPIGINDMKDAESLIRAAGERFYYAGNKLCGKIVDVERSEDCADAYYITGSTDIFTSENIAYCQMFKDSKYMFGCAWGTNNTFCINCTEPYKLNRSFETTLVNHSADAYYSYNCINCQEIMFCINQKSIRYAIGNNPLLPDKYRELKKKLLSEIVEMLKTKKTAPSHMDVLLGKIA
jgi:hypothetical protein